MRQTFAGTGTIAQKFIISLHFARSLIYLLRSASFDRPRGSFDHSAALELMQTEPANAKPVATISCRQCRGSIFPEPGRSRAPDEIRGSEWSRKTNIGASSGCPSAPVNHHKGSRPSRERRNQRAYRAHRKTTPIVVKSGVRLEARETRSK